MLTPTRPTQQVLEAVQHLPHHNNRNAQAATTHDTLMVSDNVMKFHLFYVLNKFRNVKTQTIGHIIIVIITRCPKQLDAMTSSLPLSDPDKSLAYHHPETQVASNQTLSQETVPSWLWGLEGLA
jgi:hypothetical protein